MTITDLLPIQKQRHGKIEFNNDLSLVIVLTLLTIVVVHTPLLFPIRVVLGILFAVFFPGYTLLAAIFPAKGTIDWLERFSLSIGISIALIPPIGYLLNLTPWGIRLYPILLSLTAVILLASLLALLRREKVPPEDRFFSGITITSPAIGDWSVRHKTYVAIAVVATAVGVFLYTLITSPTQEGNFTEFYVLGPSGLAQEYPRELQVGKPAYFTVGIVNNENKDMEYEVAARLGTEEMVRVLQVKLDPGASKQLQMEITPHVAVENAKAEFLLFDSGQTEPYRSLYLFVNVKSAEASR